MLEIFYVLLIGMLLSSRSVLESFATSFGAPTNQILLFSFIISLIFIFIIYKNKKLNYLNSLKYAVFGFLNFGLGYYLLNYSLRYVSRDFVLLVFFTNIIFVVFFEKLFYKRKIKIWDWISSFLIPVGITMITYENFYADNYIIGTLLVLVSAILSAIFYVIVANNINKVSDSNVSISTGMLFGATLFYVIINIFEKNVMLDLRIIFPCFLIAIAILLIPLIIMLKSLKRISSITLSVVLSSEIIFFALINFFFNSKLLTGFDYFGFAFIGVAILIIIIKEIFYT